MQQHNNTVNLGTILQFLITHAETIFSATLALILLLSGFLIFRGFFVRDSAGSEASPADLSRIEDSLRKILSQTNGNPGAQTTGPSGEPLAPGEAGVAASPGVSTGGDAQLRQEIATRTQQIEELKKQIETAKGQDNTPELLAKIKNLEDRLTEYEIIEDDIADLSIYKEENARLKKEIDSLKGGQPATAETLVAAAVAPPAPTADVVAPSTPATQANLVEEFDAAVENLEKQTAPQSAPVETPVAAAPPPEVQTPAPVAAAPAGAVQDIFAEMQGEPAGTDLLAELGDIDADRMLEEIKDLGESLGDAGVLEEDLDIDKIASEADGKKG